MTTLLDRLTHHCHIVETGMSGTGLATAATPAKACVEAREQVRLNRQEGVDGTR
jgi:hypothetical protein